MRVLPSGFRLPLWVPDAQVWTPASFDAAYHSQRGMRMGMTVGRLASKVTVEQARTGFDVILTRLRQEHPNVIQGEVIHLAPLHEEMVGEVRPALIILLGVVGFVLLIARVAARCAPIDNL